MGFPIMPSDEQAIRDLVAAWLDASKRHDNDAVLALMADDVVFLQPGMEPIRGRAAFARMQQGQARVAIEAQAQIQEIRVMGDWAYCWNQLNVTITPRDGAAATTRTGPVLSVLNKQHGRWVIVRDANMLAPSRR